MSNARWDFFHKLSIFSQFILRPNRRKLKPTHPDLVGMYRDKDNTLFVVYGWVSFDEKEQANILKCTVSRAEDQNMAQQIYKAGTPVPTVDVPEGFTFEGGELPI